MIDREEMIEKVTDTEMKIDPELIADNRSIQALAPIVTLLDVTTVVESASDQVIEEVFKQILDLVEVLMAEETHFSQQRVKF